MYLSRETLTAVSRPSLRKGFGVSRNVVGLGFTSLFTDISSEMVSAVLPMYLMLYLRLSPLQFGVVDGLYQGVSALVRADYYGRVLYKPDNAANDETFGAKVLFDVDLGYQATKNLYFAIGGDNIFNTFPDKNTKDANISFGRFLYSRNVSQFGINGGFYYAKLQLTFF